MVLHVGHEARLADRQHVVAVEDLHRVLGPQLFVGGQRGLGDLQHPLVDLAQAGREGLTEGEVDGHREEVADRLDELVVHARELFRHPDRDGGLQPVQLRVATVERLLEVGLVVFEGGLDGRDGLFVDDGPPRDGPQRCFPKEHRSTLPGAAPKCTGTMRAQSSKNMGGRFRMKRSTSSRASGGRFSN